jgi:hypothetical protein
MRILQNVGLLIVAAAWGFGCSNSSGAVYNTQTYVGQGDPYYGGGAIANGGRLTLGDISDPNYVKVTFSSAPDTSLSHYMVLFIDSTAAGFRDTTSFSDTATDRTRAISGFNGVGRSTAIFAGGFGADYAVLLVPNPGAAPTCEIYQLASGGSGSLVWQAAPVVSDNGVGNCYFYINRETVGLAPGGGFRFQSSYASEFGGRYLESFEPFTADGYGMGHTLTFGAYNSFDLAPVPEPANVALAIFGGLGLGVCGFRVWRRSAARRRLISNELLKPAGVAW